MKDSQGKDLEQGQRVVVLYQSPPGPTFLIARVVGFSPKNVRIGRTRQEQEQGWGSNFCAKPSWCTIIPEEDYEE